MNTSNFEFKAKVDALEQYEQKLLALDPLFKGTDHQTDTYFNVPQGRLKLREGNIENALIGYSREDKPDVKQSEVVLYNHTPDPALKNILTKQLGVKAVVEKTRKIYFLGNVKFHFDHVKDLGTFLEVEAIDDKNAFTRKELEQQCSAYFDFFALPHNSLVNGSYSDLIMALP